MNEHQKACASVNAAPESIYGLFDPDDKRGQGGEPDVSYCTKCTTDTSLQNRRRSDVIGWTRCVRGHT